MRLSLAFSALGFSIAALMAFVFESQFFAGVGFAAGLAWIGMWMHGF